MRSWVLIPHFYQPPTQSQTLTETILRSCYLPFLDLLEKNPQVEMTLNLSASLIIQLESIQNHDFFPKVKKLVDRGQIEFLNSAIFHPVLPLTPQDVILRQIKENATVIERFFAKPVPGFFPPELAVDEKLLKLLSKQMEFIVVDESSANPNFDLNKINNTAIQQYNNIKLLISSRSLTELLRAYPTELKAEQLIKFINHQHLATSNQLLVCATDAEVFGHHYAERINLLKDLFQSQEFKFIKATDAISNFGSEGARGQFQISNLDAVTASSWQTSSADLKNNTPFALWNSPSNPLQQKYHHLSSLAHAALEQCSQLDPNSHIIHAAQNHYDQGISSCHPYWLSNTPWWHPDMVELGARNLIKAIRTLPVDQKYKTDAENYYHNFMLEVWTHHWSGEVERRYAEFDKIRPDLLKGLPKI